MIYSFKFRVCTVKEPIEKSHVKRANGRWKLAVIFSKSTLECFGESQTVNGADISKKSGPLGQKGWHREKKRLVPYSTFLLG